MGIGAIEMDRLADKITRYVNSSDENVTRVLIVKDQNGNEYIYKKGCEFSVMEITIVTVDEK